MPCVRLGLALLLVVVSLGEGGVYHVHDTSGAGIYDAWCPLGELGDRVAVWPLSPPTTPRIGLSVERLIVAADGVLVGGIAERALPRGPPRPSNTALSCP